MQNSSRFCLSLFSLFLLSCGPDGGNSQRDGGQQVSADAKKTPEHKPGIVDAQICDEIVEVKLEQTVSTPDFLLVMDQSGSMNKRFSGGSGTRWKAVRTALDTLVSSKEQTLKFGLMFFPGISGGCSVDSVLVEPALNQRTSILAEIDRNSPNGSTPIPGALKKAKEYFSSKSVNPDGRYVLIATDGSPSNRCSGGSASQAIEKSIDAIAALKADGINSYVLGLDISNAEDFLSKMAVAGGTVQHHTANSPDKLAMVLDEIIGQVAVVSCSFKLAQKPANEDDINVTIGTRTLDRDSADGWSYNSTSNTISLLGAACDGLKDGNDTNINVDLGCGGIIID